eukprot:m.295665 g.295665  ORF g.295665 m.295665 type:complete len:53 (-) comp20044_c1_seq1:1084-1242(-)
MIRSTTNIFYNKTRLCLSQRQPCSSTTGVKDCMSTLHNGEVKVLITTTACPG